MNAVHTVSDLKVDFRLHEAVIHAVKGVSYRVPANRTVALVGESGSGKSVVSQTILCIRPPAAANLISVTRKRLGSETEITALDPDSPRMRAFSAAIFRSSFKIQ